MLLSKLCFAVILIDILFHSVSGQFPAACTDNANNEIKVCCPSNCSGPDHGTCVNITGNESTDWSSIKEPGKTVVNTVKRVGEVFGTIDSGYQWPTEVFTNVCVCRGNYAGPDCSECDFGYEMDNITGTCKEVSSFRERKNILKMSSQERTDLIKVLNESKNERQSDYKWAVIVEEPDNATRKGLRLENVATYDLFVYQHFFSKRDGDVRNKNGSKKICEDISNENFSRLDYGHKGPTFLTWHRYYLLLVERELGRIAERLGSPNGWNRYTFALPYWDWDDSDEVKNDIFSRSYFGTFDFDPKSNSTPVEGVLFDDNNWPTVCDKHYRQLVNDREDGSINCSELRSVCTPKTDRNKAQRLERGWFRRGFINHSERSLPAVDAIKNIFCQTSNTLMYDAVDMNGSYGIESASSSFRNRLEGFVKYDNVTEKFSAYGHRTTINNFHNAVHIFIHGHMKVVPYASNDPIFYLHHANVDRIFEMWLQGPGRRTYVPEQGNRVAHPGHNSEDYMVPFFPVKKNSDMYEKSTYFGYMYDQELEICEKNGAGSSALRWHPRSFLGFILGISIPIITVVMMSGRHLVESLQV